MPSTTKLPTYIPPWKGKVKATKDLEPTKSALQTPLLPDVINFEGSPLGRVPTMKFEDWDLADSEKFPHMGTEILMKQKVEGLVIMLEPQKSMRDVEKAGLLHLRWIPHFHHVPITIFIIRQLLCLVHDGYLWLEEPIPITAELIHRIYQLPYKGRDPAEIAGRSSNLALGEAMKNKYKLEKKKRSYAIASIKDRGIRVATQLLAKKVMRKCCADEVPTPMVALAE